MKTILVTGGVGFIGGNFVRHLFAKYPTYRFIVVDLLTYAGRIDNSPANAMESGRYEFWYGDVGNGELIENLVRQADVVVHMAAETHVTRSIYDNRLFFDTDVLGTQTVANAVVKHRDRVERFIHVSTSEVYGTAITKRMDEDHPLNPLSPYSAAKCGADRLVYSYRATYDIPAVIVRPFNNYGPRQHLEKAIPRFITSCLLNEPLRVHGDGSAMRDWVFVEDNCDALDRILHADREAVIGEVINIGTGDAMTILQVATAVRDAMQAERSPIEFIGDRPGQVFRHTCDASKAKRLLGWIPCTPFADGLRQTIDWYRENEAWWQPQMWMRQIPIITASGKRELH
ncbi:MAG: GDP-mannose 4,6-dehydratase [Chloroflexota bacterium]